MPLCSMKWVLERALAGGYAVGAFNANNMELVQGAIWAAEESKSPVIIQISPGAIKYARLQMAVAMVRAAAAEATVPVVIHLDHGQDLGVCTDCAESLFGGIMFDGSELSLNKWRKDQPGEEPTLDELIELVNGGEALMANIEATRAVVNMAKGYNPDGHCLCVEGEIGHIPKMEQLLTAEQIAALCAIGPCQEAVDFIRTNCGKKVAALMASPPQAAQFVKDTGVYSLAAAFGSIHGLPFDAWPVRLDRLAELRKATGVPLVSHGSSGILRTRADAERMGIQLQEGEGTLEDAVKIGLAKVNVATALSMMYLSAFDGHRQAHPGERDLRKPAGAGRDAVKALVAEYMQLLGSAGKA